MDFINEYKKIRKQTIDICKPLKTEDYVPQPVEHVSPPKWHLAHTTWFFETFLLKKYHPNYKEFDPKYAFLFNSYYENEGQRTLRAQRGFLSRPTVDEILQYRKYIDTHMVAFLKNINLDEELNYKIALGLNHEQQHQELLLTDIKFILSLNPLKPVYSKNYTEMISGPGSSDWITVNEGIYKIGHKDLNFTFDNELANHNVYLNEFQIRNRLVTNKEFIEFIDSNGYSNFNLWHSDAWAWIQNENVKAPLYWNFENSKWYHFTLSGYKEIDINAPVTHISYYEAHAFAQWKKMRLPTEFEWEAASGKFKWGQAWEWTESAYLPYPGFAKASGAIGEYNGKFMVNQKVLRGASIATPEGHSRKTYRNFFHPHFRWQFTGIRLAK